MRNKKHIAVLLSIGVLAAITLTACSNGGSEKLLSPQISKSPLTEITPEPESTPTPTIINSLDDINAPGYEDLNFIYESNFEDTYAPDVLNNLEIDSNNLVHTMNGGELTYFVQPYDGPHDLRLDTVRTYLGENAFNDLAQAYEEGDSSTILALIPQVNQDGTFTFEGNQYMIADLKDVPYSVTMTNQTDDVTFRLSDEEDVPGVYMNRNITIHYITNSQERIWDHREISYLLQPNVDGHWVIAGWSSTSQGMGIDSADELFTT